jgi:hypothetical protein
MPQPESDGKPGGGGGDDEGGRIVENVKQSAIIRHPSSSSVV